MHPDESQNLLVQSKGKNFLSLQYKNELIEEGPSKAKIFIKKIIEGKIVVITMAFVTLFAIIGDDLRLWTTRKTVDTGYYALLMISFLLFIIEIIANSIVIEDFKYSFYFWLDIIATLSLITDIIWLSELFNFLVGSDSYYSTVDVTPGKMFNSFSSIVDTK